MRVALALQMCHTVKMSTTFPGPGPTDGVGRITFFSPPHVRREGTTRLVYDKARGVIVREDTGAVVLRLDDLRFADE